MRQTTLSPLMFLMLYGGVGQVKTGHDSGPLTADRSTFLPFPKAASGGPSFFPNKGERKVLV